MNNISQANTTRWWGWGDLSFSYNIASHPGIARYLTSRFGIDKIQPPRDFDILKVKIPPSLLPQELLTRLSAIIGNENCRIDHETRVRHALGKGYRDLLELRSLQLREAPDAVVFPADARSIHTILNFCKETKIAVVPFGGGTSVVGGVNTLRGKFPYSIAINTTQLSGLISIDAESMTAEIGAGTFGPEIEQLLNKHGWSLGHFPQSFEFSTLGGWIAARSSGQNSLGYGSIAKMLVSLKIVTPKGEIQTLETPGHATGPDMVELLAGSEGICGVITSARVKIHPLPEEQHYFMTAFRSFRKAADAAKEIVQLTHGAALVRISDEEESSAMLAFRDDGGLMAGASKLFLRMNRLTPGESLVFLMLGFEGKPFDNRRHACICRSILKRHGATYLGRGPGRHWLKERFRLPYLRDEFMDNGIFLETLETAAPWSKLQLLYDDVRKSILEVFNRHGLPGTVLTHISHVYPDGASLYFTALGAVHKADPENQWRELKNATNEVIKKHGAPISHHHGVGIDHRSYLHWSALEHELVKSIKHVLDPDGILNPGKLL